MARRRMFSLDVVHEDKFLDMPLTSQALYFHLGMVADDDGFVGSASSIMRQIGAKEDDRRVLLAKGYILNAGINTGDSVFVITHWKINNEIKNDRYTPTIYKAQIQRLSIANNRAYFFSETVSEQALLPCIQLGYSLDTQYRLDENSEDKDRKDSIPAKLEMSSSIGIIEQMQADEHGTARKQTQVSETIKPEKREQRRFIPPRLEDIENYIVENGYSNVDAKKFFNYYSASDWHDKDGMPVKNWKQKVITWSGRNTNKKGKTVNGTDAEKDYSAIPNGYASL